MWRHQLPLTVSPFALTVALGATLLIACGSDDAPVDAEPAAATVPLEIRAVRVAVPALAGSPLVVESRGLLSDTNAILRVGAVELQAEGPAVAGTITFRLDTAGFTSLGRGDRTVDLVLAQGERESDPFSLALTVGGELPLALESTPSGTIFRDAPLLFTGAGFIDPSEGDLLAHFEGSFASNDEVPEDVDARVPLELVSFDDRSRATARLDSSIGGIASGRFTGTVTIERRLEGADASTGRDDVLIDVPPPTLFAPESERLAIGQYLTVAGGGLLGAHDQQQSTLVRLDGVFTDAADTDTPVEAVELVAEVLDHDRLRVELPYVERRGQLVVALFDSAEGTFAGTMTPVTLDGSAEESGDAVPLRFDVLGVHQHVEVVFLPGFFESLRHFGLVAASDAIVAGAVERMNSIYADYPVYFATEPPPDFVPGALSRLEVGGPDPNGRGLLGYDNTPGKDIGNLRLHDVIGGANAETQADDYPGYGGVFIDSFLYWSANPGLPGPRPSGAPPADPLFDILFAEVRATPATLAEVRGDGQRAFVVSAAVDALAAMIGETSAHEVGHSLGLAQPFGASDSFHSALPAAGCLMDSGRDRPLGERAAQPGFDETRFCFDEPAYLDEILGATTD